MSIAAFCSSSTTTTSALCGKPWRRSARCGGDDYAGMTSLYRTPLGPILPAAPTGRVLEEPFRAKITKEGFRHPVTQGLTGSNLEDGRQEPAWGHWFRQAKCARPRTCRDAGRRRATALLVLDRKGKGRVALLTSDHAWLWRAAMRGGPHTDSAAPPLALAHEGAGSRGRAARRVCQGFEALDRAAHDGGRQGRARHDLCSGGRGALGGETREEEPGLWRADIDVKLPGLYKAETPGPSGLLTAVAHAGIEDPREMSEVVATEEKLKPIAEGTGGASSGRGRLRLNRRRRWICRA